MGRIRRRPYGKLIYFYWLKNTSSPPMLNAVNTGKLSKTFSVFMPIAYLLDFHVNKYLSMGR